MIFCKIYFTFPVFLCNVYEVIRESIIFFSRFCFMWILNFGMLRVMNLKKIFVPTPKFYSNKKERPTQNGYITQQCIICYSEDREMILKPCNHICVCQNCCKRIIQESNKCPFCQNQIIQRERIYLP